MRLIHLARAAAIMLPLTMAIPVHAQAQCDALNKAIDVGLKQLSLLEYAGLDETSAPRDTSRKVDQANWLQAIQINITLLQANGCKLPQLPIERDAYWKDARACHKAPRPRGDDVAPQCVFANWKRSLE